MQRITKKFENKLERSPGETVWPFRRQKAEFARRGFSIFYKRHEIMMSWSAFLVVEMQTENDIIYSNSFLLDYWKSYCIIDSVLFLFQTYHCNPGEKTSLQATAYISFSFFFFYSRRGSPPAISKHTNAVAWIYYIGSAFCPHRGWWIWYCKLYTPLITRLSGHRKIIVSTSNTNKFSNQARIHLSSMSIPKFHHRFVSQ